MHLFQFNIKRALENILGIGARVRLYVNISEITRFYVTNVPASVGAVVLFIT
jgi:hypothetical protein